MPGCVLTDRGLLRFCCREAASLLFAREPGWVIYDGRVAVAVRFCPLCGGTLPDARGLLFRECGHEGCRNAVPLRSPAEARCGSCSTTRPVREEPEHEAPVLAMKRRD